MASRKRERDYKAEYQRAQEIARSKGFSGKSERFRLQHATRVSARGVSSPAQRSYDAFRRVFYASGKLSSPDDNAQSLRLYQDYARNKVHFIDKGSNPRESLYQGKAMDLPSMMEEKGIVSGGIGAGMPSGMSEERQAAYIEDRYHDTYGHYPESADDIREFIDDEGFYDFDWDDFWQSYTED